MVIQKAVDNLKERPKDERKAVAGGIAVTVVAVLFIAWSIFFLKNLGKTAIDPKFQSGAQSEFDFNSVREAQERLLQEYSSESALEAELRAVRESSRQHQQPAYDPNATGVEDDSQNPFQ